jgi:hypothetical protein
MSFLRRFATVSLVTASLAVGAGLAAPAAVAAGWGGGPGHGHGHGHHAPPLMFGPFEIPREGGVSSGFSWSMR